MLRIIGDVSKQLAFPMLLETLPDVRVTYVETHRRRVLFSCVSYVISETLLNLASPKMVFPLCLSYIVLHHCFPRSCTAWLLRTATRPSRREGVAMEMPSLPFNIPDSKFQHCLHSILISHVFMFKHFDSQMFSSKLSH